MASLASSARLLSRPAIATRSHQGEQLQDAALTAGASPNICRSLCAAILPWRHRPVLALGRFGRRSWSRLDGATSDDHRQGRPATCQLNLVLGIL